MACSTAQHSLAAGPTALLSPGAIFQCSSSHGEMLCLLHRMPRHCHFCLHRGHPWHHHTFPARSETHAGSGDTLKILCQCWLGARRDRLAQLDPSSPWHRERLQLRQSRSTGASMGSLGMGGTLSNQTRQLPTGPVAWLRHMGDGHGASHPPLRGQQGPGRAPALGRTGGDEGPDLTVGISHWRVCSDQLLLEHTGLEMGTAMIHHPHHCAAQSVPL